jgi:hypothetical protein
MTDAAKVPKCTVCGIRDPEGDTICPFCKAEIRGEALDQHHQIRKDAASELHKTGTEVLKKGG